MIKKLFSIKSCLLLFMLLVVSTAFAQGAVPELSVLLEKVDWLFAGFVTVTGYLSYKIPFFNRINKSVYRVAAIAIVIAAVFLYWGSDANGLIWGYLGATNFYSHVLKLFSKSKTPEEKEIIQ